MKASRITSRNASPRNASRAASRVAAAAGVAGAAVLVLSSPAYAHVSVQPDGTAAKGGYALVNFRVPNERDDASTTKLEVTFPTDHPLSSVMPEKLDGWKITVTKSKLAKPLEVHGQQINEAVSKVTWTAEDKGVEPGYLQRFPVSMGALPDDADELVFKAVQTYSDKEVVRWIEVQEDGAEEPENPAPVLALADASEDEHSHGTTTAEDASDESDDAKAAASTTEAASDSSGGSDTTARVLGVVGIVVGAAGVAYGVLAGRRRTTPES
ncbi:YcnI family protein [Streptomyces sp. NBC_01275]|uniref:YcnI family copper-binding membrane protein n=1 Tax=Streptomyces sp. NBC_01275 TaxID=2903807 RepID=UPI0022567FA0|nr:YcnI family protein [Streptomyces sp. NBC_01275]MCX4763361.1 YcnI family protein [Streptomyces sp. NBC_01275]